MLDVENRELQERLREQHAERDRKPLLPLEAARANRHVVRFDDLPTPLVHRHAQRRGRRSRSCAVHRLAVLLPRVGAEGQVPGDPRAAGGARALRRRAGAPGRDRPRRAVRRARRLRLLARARRGDDIVARRRRRASRACASRPTTATRARTARSPTTSRPPATTSARSRVSIHGADELAARYEAEHDDYRAIMAKALADRLAEAFAEYLHERARFDWGYEQASGSRARTWSPSATAASGRPSAIRPAPTTPRRSRLFELLDAPTVGMELTETFATLPAASVSGLYFHHPEARYFSVGRIGRDQVEDYAARKGHRRRRSGAVACSEPRLHAPRSLQPASGDILSSRAGALEAFARFSR